MTERIFARTCSCGRRVPAGQRCPCKPDKRPQATPTEAQRLRRQPSRKGYKDVAHKQARKVAIQRATGPDGRVRCEACGLVVGQHFDRRGRAKDYQAHHRDGNPMNNPLDGSNHVILCEGKGTNQCHEAAERELKKLKRAR